MAKSEPLVRKILPDNMQIDKSKLTTAINLLSNLYPGLEHPKGENVTKQRNWDDAVSKSSSSTFITQLTKLTQHACWLQLLPILVHGFRPSLCLS